MAATVRPVSERFPIRSAEDAEHAAAQWMRAVGFSGIAVGRRGADGGIDVTSDQALAQVKAEAKPVGRPVLQAIYGLARARDKVALTFALAGFTREALDFADEVGIALLRFDLDGEAVPLNATARGLASQLQEDNPFGVPDSYLGDGRQIHANARRSRTYAFQGDQDYVPPFHELAPTYSLFDPVIVGSHVVGATGPVNQRQLVKIPLDGGPRSPLLPELDQLGCGTFGVGDNFAFETRDLGLGLCTLAGTTVWETIADPDVMLAVGPTSACESDGAVLIGGVSMSADQAILASFSTDSGRRRWLTDTPCDPKRVASGAFVDRVAAGDGLVAVAQPAANVLRAGVFDRRVSPFGTLAVHRFDDGALLWTYPDIYVESLHMAGGTVMVLGALADPWLRGCIAFDGRSGTILWSSPNWLNVLDSDLPDVDPYHRWSMSLVVGPRTAWFVDGQVTALSLRSGATRWRTPTHDEATVFDTVYAGEFLLAVVQVDDAMLLRFIRPADGSEFSTSPPLPANCEIEAVDGRSVLLRTPDGLLAGTFPPIDGTP